MRIANEAPMEMQFGPLSQRLHFLIVHNDHYLRSVKRRAASASTPSLSSSVLIRCKAKMILLLSAQNFGKHMDGKNGKFRTNGDVPADLNNSLSLVVPHVQLPRDVPKHVLRITNLSLYHAGSYDFIPEQDNLCLWEQVEVSSPSIPLHLPLFRLSFRLPYPLSLYSFHPNPFQIAALKEFSLIAH